MLIILFYHAFSISIDLYLLIPAVIAQILNPAAELAIRTGTPTVKAKAEIKTEPVIVQTKISECLMFKIL